MKTPIPFRSLSAGLLGLPLFLSQPAAFGADSVETPEVVEEVAPPEEGVMPEEGVPPAEVAPLPEVDAAVEKNVEETPGTWPSRESRRERARDREKADREPAPESEPTKPSPTPAAEAEPEKEVPARPEREMRRERERDRQAEAGKRDRKEEAEKRRRPERETPEATKPPAPATPEDVAAVEPESEPEKQAETQVREATRAVERELDQRKTRIRDKDEAQALIDEILGAESEISRAEIAREERVRPRIDAADRRRGRDRAPDASPDERRAAVRYFEQRLLGNAVDEPPPVFLRQDRRFTERGPAPDVRVEERFEEREEFRRPRYLNEGRRYVHFDSRAAIPAILMAAEALNRVTLQPVREVAPIFYEGREVNQAMPLPPENYRDEDAWVVSYPVDEKSMITSDDILFLQGSTQFSDPYSYEIVSTLAEAMKDLPAGERFVIEGHASAEGGYEDNMTLSQQRAERIVREMVRRGVQPSRLLPVGYGESEARHPADAAENLRRQDRRVVVFRLKEEPMASR